jgi:hypothetical protein
LNFSFEHCGIFLFFIEGNGGSTTTTTTTVSTSQMYLVITTAIWMNKTSSKPKMQPTGSAQNVPFGVFGVMLPYKTVRSTHFSNLCVRI